MMALLLFVKDEYYFLRETFFVADLRVVFFADFLAVFLGGGGTFAPFSLASLKAIAIACLGFLTLPPFPPGPLSSFPFFIRCITDSTVSWAFLEYFAIGYYLLKNRQTQNIFYLM